MSFFTFIEKQDRQANRLIALVLPLGELVGRKAVVRTFIHLATLLAIILLPLNLRSQDSLFAFANVEAVEMSTATPVTNYKYKTAKKVFDRLVNARGDRYKAIPTFVMNNGRQYMAWMSPIAVEIGLEERMYDVCTQFGADSLSAMATILAHELTHYYENHDWSRNFVNQNEALATSEAIANTPEAVKSETQADYLGGILAISAGYDAYELMPELLGKAYTAYGLPETMPGYPSLADRQKISQNTADELKDLHAIYRTANLLVLVDAYAVGLTYYERVLNTFQSYEVYNNAGVCALLAYLDLLKPEEMPYALPLELDGSSRLDRLATRLPEDSELTKEKLLQKARNYLNNAVNMTERQPSVALNMAVYYLLEGEYFDAEYWATKAQRMSIRNRLPRTGGNAQIVLGIIAAREDRLDEAEQLFTMASAKSKSLAETNLAILNGTDSGGPIRPMTALETEKINDTDLEELLFDLPGMDVDVQVNRAVFCGKKEYEDHSLFVHLEDDGEQYAAFQRTKPTYDKPSLAGIRRGATATAVMDEYGVPDKLLNQKEVYCLRYDTQKIIFRFDGATDRLVDWIIFAYDLK